jgi:phosphonoacetaldehyde hydrolase
MPESSIRLAVLDWAGTTVDFGCFAPAVTFQEVFRQNGVEISTPEARGPMGLPKKDHLRAIAALPRVADRWREAHGRPIGEAEIDRLYFRFEPLQIATLEHHGDVIPGALEAVAELRRRGIRVGSTTGYSRSMMEVVVRHASAAGLTVDALVCADEVPAGRPAPWMALRNMELLGVYPPSACVKVGDTVPDIDEGLHAGMWTVAVTETSSDMGMTQRELSGLAKDERLARIGRVGGRFLNAGAHHVIDSIRNLPEVIVEIEARIEKGEKP